eukprot:5315169-Lingulodinium_polyedra.AAC.1
MEPLPPLRTWMARRRRGRGMRLQSRMADMLLAMVARGLPSPGAAQRHRAEHLHEVLVGSAAAGASEARPLRGPF